MVISLRKRGSQTFKVLTYFYHNVWTFQVGPDTLRKFCELAKWSRHL